MFRIFTKPSDRCSRPFLQQHKLNGDFGAAHALRIGHGDGDRERMVAVGLADRLAARNKGRARNKNRVLTLDIGSLVS